MGLELLWRGWTHGSMFFAGGSSFLLLGEMNKHPAPLLVKGLVGATAITSVELLTGLLVNRRYGVWDYRRMPLNFRGQVCLPFFLLWIPVSLGAMVLYKVAEKHI